MATATTPLPEPVPQGAISPWGRVTGVLFSPGATFADIAKAPNWILPVVITTVLALISVTILNTRVNWNDFIRQKIEQSPRAAQLSPEQKEQQVGISVKITKAIVYASGLLISILFAVIVGAVMMLAYNLLGGAGATFKQSLSIVAHAGLVGLVSTPIFVLVLLLKPFGTADPDNPVVTNIGAFLSEDTPKWLMALCKSLDIFTIWMLILMAIGFAAVNPRKLKGGTSYAIAFGVWGAFVVVKVLWAFAFS